MRNNKKGFTFVELLVVIGIIAILMVIAIPGVFTVSNKMKSRGLSSKLEAIEEAAVIYAQENSNQIKKDLQRKYNLRDCKNDSAICKCTPNSSSKDCKYYFTMTVKELIEKKAYKSENTKDESKTCDVADPTDGSYCLDCAKIYIELDDDYKTATAKIDRDKLDTYRIKRETISSSGATCP